MSDFTDFYKNLLILQYANKAKASSEIEVYASDFEEVYQFLKDFETEFDIDLATGDRLDKIGKIVGQDRIVEGGIVKKYFGYLGAGPNALPYGEGRYKTADDDTYSDSQLDDGQYRIFIRAKIAKNNASAVIASGDRAGIQASIQLLFNGQAFIIDNLDMTLNLLVSEDYPSDDLTLIEAADLIPRPQGVDYKIFYYDEPIFGYLGAGPNAAGYGEGRYIRDANTPAG